MKLALSCDSIHFFWASWSLTPLFSAMCFLTLACLIFSSWKLLCLIDFPNQPMLKPQTNHKSNQPAKELSSNQKNVTNHAQVTKSQRASLILFVCEASGTLDSKVPAVASSALRSDPLGTWIVMITLQWWKERTCRKKQTMVQQLLAWHSYGNTQALYSYEALLWDTLERHTSYDTFVGHSCWDTLRTSGTLLDTVVVHTGALLAWHSSGTLSCLWDTRGMTLLQDLVERSCQVIVVWDILVMTLLGHTLVGHSCENILGITLMWEDSWYETFRKTFLQNTLGMTLL